MTTVQLIIVCATLLSLALIVGAALVFGRSSRRSVPPPRIGHRVTVHTKQPDDQTLFGVLVGDYKDRIVLEDAEYVTAAGAKPLPGTQHVATEHIAWIDAHAPVSPAALEKFERSAVR